MPTPKKQSLWNRTKESITEVKNTQVALQSAILVGSVVCLGGFMVLTAVAISHTNINITIVVDPRKKNFR